MPGWYRVQVIVDCNSGLPEDSITNTWHYQQPGSTPVPDDDAFDFETQLASFYGTWVPEMGSSNYDWATMVTRHYNLADTLPRVPFREGTIGSDPPLSGRNDYPAEVAVCLSMAGVVTSGVNARRRRGRVFCGPIAMGGADLPTLPQVNAEIILDAAEAAFFDSVDTQLAVYSRLTHYGIAVGGEIGPEDEPNNAFLGSSMNQVVKLWVDNAWDTQRRRGRGPSQRWTALLP